MDEVIKKLKDHDEQRDIIARTIVDHTERLDRIENKLTGMVTKEDHQRVMNTLDKLLKLTEKKDQEVTLLAHAQKTTNDRLDSIEKDIKQMKPALGLS